MNYYRKKEAERQAHQGEWQGDHQAHPGTCLLSGRSLWFTGPRGWRNLGDRAGAGLGLRVMEVNDCPGRLEGQGSED